MQAFSKLVILFFLLMYRCIDNSLSVEIEIYLNNTQSYILYNFQHSPIFCIVFSKMCQAEVNLN